MRGCAASRVACGATALPHHSRRGSARPSAAQVQLPRPIPLVVLQPSQLVQPGAEAAAAARLAERAGDRRSGGTSGAQRSSRPAARQQHAWELLGCNAQHPPAAQDAASSSASSSTPGSSAGAAARGGGSPPPPPALASSQLGVQLNEPPPAQQQGGGGGGGERDRDFFANVGDAIRTLREDYPLLFVKDLNYAIYREDVTFKDPNLTFRGLRNYRLIFWSLRFHGRLFLSAAHVQVLRIWQPDDAVIKLRWQVSAKPRMGASGTFDGISIYRLDRAGRVYQHEVTDVQLRDPPITNPLLYGLNFVLNPQPAMQPTPCPGSWFTNEGEEEAAEAVAGAAPAPAPALVAASGGQE